MESNMLSLMLFAQTKTDPEVWYDNPWIIVLMMIALAVVPYIVGRFVSSVSKSEDTTWRTWIVLFSISAAALVVVTKWPPNLDIDLAGGTKMEFQILPNDDGTTYDENRLVNAVSKRADPDGNKQIIVRKTGTDRIEVQIPAINPEEVADIQRRITSAGLLEFRILADRRYSKDREIIEKAEQLVGVKQLKDRDVNARASDGNRAHIVEKARALSPTETAVKIEDRLRARWEPIKESEKATFAADADLVTRDVPGGKQKLLIVGRTTARWFPIGTVTEGENEGDLLIDIRRGKTVVRQNAKGKTEALVLIDAENVEGRFLDSVQKQIDREGGGWQVAFSFKSEGAKRFGRLTGENVPNESGFKRRLAVVLDNELLSAPDLNSRIDADGRITGNFSEKEVDNIVGVLDAGSLPASLDSDPISLETFTSNLGEDTIAAGKKAIFWSFLLVAVFMPVYYRFAGLVACFALFVNLLLVLGIMVGFDSAFSLPGLAGLVLTVGMAVDANVLIFERIREETARGAALRMAIRNGFSRATRTIVDANVTTLITGVVLLKIGTPQLQGFATVLIIGILMSMYTAIFCSRLIFDVAERTRLITKLSMTRILGVTNFNFISKRTLAAILSLLLITIGMIGVYQRGAGILHIDFLGGSKVQVVFKQDQEDEFVRSKLRQHIETLPDLHVVRIGSADAQQGDDQQEIARREFKIETSQSDINILKATVKTVFGDLLETNTLAFDSNAFTTILAAGSNEPAATPTGSPTFAPTPEDESGEAATEGTAATTEDAETTSAETPVTETPVTGAPATETTATESDGLSSTVSGDSEEVLGVQRFAGGTLATLNFGKPVNKATVESLVRQAIAKSNDIADVDSDLSSVGKGEQARFTTWEFASPLSKDSTGNILAAVQTHLDGEPLYTAASKTGERVSRDFRINGIFAIVASLLAIVAYIWIRFQKVTFGLAAVIALAHDVAVTLGIIALSGYAAEVGFLRDYLLIEPFKISLVTLAAFLTIIGYSLNDTIVVFDRIREVRGKSPDLTEDMVNRSINQTLSRTLLTSVTTLIVVVILYFWGGAGIHGFAFALVVGVMVGTYSSIFVASPALLWMTHLGLTPETGSDASASRARASAAS